MKKWAISVEGAVQASKGGGGGASGAYLARNSGAAPLYLYARLLGHMIFHKVTSDIKIQLIKIII